MGLKEHLREYVFVFLLFILAYSFALAVTEYKENNLRAEVNTTQVTEYPSTCANSTLINEFPDIDFTSPETIAKLTINPMRYVAGNDSCMYMYALNGRLFMKQCADHIEYYEAA